jgi:MFS transporter, putative metabolite:H+ symporter
MREATVAARLNRLPISNIHKKATILIGIGLFFDIYDIFLSGVLGTVLAKQFGVSQKELPLLVGSSFLGMFLGAIFLGRMADKIGRKKAYLLNLAIYSLFTLLGAFSDSAATLILFRFLAGLGLGAETPLSDTYLSELLPASHRGRYIAWAYTISFVAVPVVGFLGRGLVPMHPLGIDGWRWLFVIGSLGAFIVWFLRRDLPESPRWLESVGRIEEAKRLAEIFEEDARKIHGSLPATEEIAVKISGVFPFRLLFTREYIGRTLMLWLFQILQTIGYYGFGSLVPLILAAKGYTVINSLEYTALSYLGYPLGSLLSLLVVERIDRKWLIVLSAFLMGVFGLSFGMAGSSGAVITFGVLYTLASNIFSNAFHIFQAEIFPTFARATAAGTAYSLSRLTSGLMPFLLLPVLKQHGATAMFTVVAAAMLLIILDIGIFGPKTARRSLESVNDVPAAGTSTPGHPPVSPLN